MTGDRNPDARGEKSPKSTCLDIRAGEFTGDALNKRVAERLSGGNATIDEKQAAEVVELMREHIC
ncbi:hypothetical protein [Micromonospora cathayae]|uniref:DUF732 domain-containing protein n=1 Tax=Micromonospora cathayae TaxID=3028804 RepID=A0ABY7ZW00_9ACTN|nr:hypothetical protein [Micromonospora sp. HUAS 3]WDZ87197.1 hypothetical protein PVK37_12715 [Micromonospora sp. HUAS 3]